MQPLYFPGQFMMYNVSA